MEELQYFDYQKGFNEGYLIAQYMPDLSEGLSLVSKDSPYIQGMKDGRKKYLSDKKIVWVRYGRNQEKPDDDNFSLGDDEEFNKEWGI